MFVLNFDYLHSRGCHGKFKYVLTYCFYVYVYKNINVKVMVFCHDVKFELMSVKTQNKIVSCSKKPQHDNLSNKCSNVGKFKLSDVPICFIFRLHMFSFC